MSGDPPTEMRSVALRLVAALLALAAGAAAIVVAVLLLHETVG